MSETNELNTEETETKDETAESAGQVELSPEQSRVVQMLKAQAEIAKSRNERICFLTSAPIKGKASCPAWHILNKSDSQILEWMNGWGIDPGQVISENDIFWHR